MIIYFVRHGQTYNNVEKIFPYKDTDLTPKGIEQAEELSKYIKEIKFDAVYASPYKRVKHTVEILTGNNYTTDDRLVDIDTGTLLGKTIAEVTKKDKSWYSTFQDGIYNTYNVEKFSSVKSRILDFIKYMDSKNYEKILVATHLEPIRAAFSLATGVEGMPLTSLEISNCSVSVFSYLDLKLYLKSFNWLILNDYIDNKNKSFY